MEQPKSGDTVAQITVTFYAGGKLSVSGSLGDKAFAVKLLQHAIDSIKAQPRPEDRAAGSALIVPPRDVDLSLHPNYPKTPWGDLR